MSFRLRSYTALPSGLVQWASSNTVRSVRRGEISSFAICSSCSGSLNISMAAKASSALISSALTAPSCEPDVAGPPLCAGQLLMCKSAKGKRSPGVPQRVGRRARRSGARGDLLNAIPRRHGIPSAHPICPSKPSDLAISR
jgi:hypothetical protein